MSATRNLSGLSDDDALAQAIAALSFARATVFVASIIKHMI
jgi:hypothetical protein